MGWGHVPLVNYCILELRSYVATQIVLETIFEMPSVLSGVVLTHDFGIHACSTGLHQ